MSDEQIPQGIGVDPNAVIDQMARDFAAEIANLRTELAMTKVALAQARQPKEAES